MAVTDLTRSIRALATEQLRRIILSYPELIDRGDLARRRPPAGRGALRPPHLAATPPSYRLTS